MNLHATLNTYIAKWLRWKTETPNEQTMQGEILGDLTDLRNEAAPRVADECCQNYGTHTAACVRLQTLVAEFITDLREALTLSPKPQHGICVTCGVDHTNEARLNRAVIATTLGRLKQIEALLPSFSPPPPMELVDDPKITCPNCISGHCPHHKMPKPKSAPPPMEGWQPDFDKLSEAIARDLMTMGNGDHAWRIALMDIYGRNLGGWGREPAARQIARTLRKSAAPPAPPVARPKEQP